VPYGIAKSPQEFYCYNGACSGWTTNYAASSNVVEYDLIYPNRSNIFGYISTDPDDNPLTVNVPEFSLGFIHDIPDAMNAQFPDNETDGGHANFTFSCPGSHANCVNIGDGYSSMVIVAQDDPPSAVDTYNLPIINWQWSPCCTDGGMAKLLPIDTGWCITIDPTFNNGITELFIKEPGEGGYLVGYTIPNKNDPFEICYEPAF
jgi:hypothetical protein